MLKATDLRTEYLNNPVGIDIFAPRLYWKYVGDSKRQTAFQIQAAIDNNTIWDSGRVESSMGVHVPYLGPALQSRQRVEWKVRLWDEQEFVGPWSETAYFELGLNQQDWKASWISGNYIPEKGVRYPADFFSTNLSIHKSVKRARLYITACGLYVAYIDNTRVGNQKLTPGTTQYDKRLQYQTYDVTMALGQGKH